MPGENQMDDRAEKVLGDASLAIRFDVKQAAAWRFMAEIVRRHPHLQILEMHAGGGMYDEVVLWDPRRESTPVRCNYEGRVHVAPFDPWGQKANWLDVLTREPREFVRWVEEVTRLGSPRSVPRSTPESLTHRAIAHLTASRAFERHGVRMLNGVFSSSASGDGVRQAAFDAVPSIHPHRRAASKDSPSGMGEWRFWFACAKQPGSDHAAPVLAFETTGHIWKAGPDVGDRFDLNRTYEAVGRDFLQLIARFDMWRSQEG